MPKVAIYARYSSDLQSAQSIDDQWLVCRQLAQREGWEIVAEYHDEAISGGSLVGRVGMKRLLADAETGMFDILCAEALDRVSRDQEDIARVYKLLRFHGIALHTVTEGLTNELHIGLKGTMNTLFLKDLADKTRRGLRGCIEKGRSGGGLAYGYEADVIAGERIINEREALVVRRIFRDFAKGETPNAIARMLNREAVAGPSGRLWSGTTIRGHNARGTGILNNELYQGVLLWNRQRFMKDPWTGKRQSRMNPEQEWVRKQVPSLRIIDDDLWKTVKALQIAQTDKRAGLREGIRKGRELRIRGQTAQPSNFSKLLICATCGADFCSSGRDRYGCAGHYRGKACDNGKTVLRRTMEARVRDLLSEVALMLAHPATAVGVEDNALAQSVRQSIARDRQQLDELDAKLAGLMTAIEDGLYSQRVKIRFQQLEDRVDRFQASLRINGERLRSLEGSSDQKASEVLRCLIGHLKIVDDQYAILQIRRILGPVKVKPGVLRGQCVLTWDREIRPADWLGESVGVLRES